MVRVNTSSKVLPIDTPAPPVPTDSEASATGSDNSEGCIEFCSSDNLRNERRVVSIVETSPAKIKVEGD